MRCVINVKEYAFSTYVVSFTEKLPTSVEV
ncbi:hypothetical protein BN3456_01440 [Clostridium sp. C105KSO13]|nr:hypothetical protein BN3456_01440 [Clostridium sp. C105KSO13]